jgi:hypothetical protein
VCLLGVGLSVDDGADPLARVARETNGALVFLITTAGFRDSRSRKGEEKGSGKKLHCSDREDETIGPSAWPCVTRDESEEKYLVGVSDEWMPKSRMREGCFRT